jgi:hypothetical protein
MVKAVLCLGVLLGFLSWPSSIDAAGGWYLLSPPVVPDSRSMRLKVLWDAPLGAWEQQEAYDSAAACEAALLALQVQRWRKLQTIMDEMKKRHENILDLDLAPYDAMMALRCVASDDPRLH